MENRYRGFSNEVKLERGYLFRIVVGDCLVVEEFCIVRKERRDRVIGGVLGGVF